MAQDATKKAYEEQRAERAKLTEAALKRMQESQPTPTQEECDLARIGMPVDIKQDDKSGPEVITRTVIAGVPVSSHGYETRAHHTKKE